MMITKIQTKRQLIIPDHILKDLEEAERYNANVVNGCLVISPIFLENTAELFSASYLGAEVARQQKIIAKMAEHVMYACPDIPKYNPSECGDDADCTGCWLYASKRMFKDGVTKQEICPASYQSFPVSPCIQNSQYKNGFV